MNVANSQRVGSALERLGYSFTGTLEDADVIVLNTCVVRQSAEDKAYGRLSSINPLKTRNPALVVNLMGCLVGFGIMRSCAPASLMWMFSRRLPTPIR